MIPWLRLLQGATSAQRRLARAGCYCLAHGTEHATPRQMADLLLPAPARTGCRTSGRLAAAPGSLALRASHRHTGYTAIRISPTALARPRLTEKACLVTPIATLSRLTIATLLIAAYAASAGAAGAKSTKKSAKNTAETTTSSGPLYATRTDVMALADDIAQRRNLDAEWVRHAIGQSRYMPFIAKAITPPPAGRTEKLGSVPQPLY